VIYAQKDSINLAKIPPKDQVAIQEQIKAYLARLEMEDPGILPGV
jgi:hypothetical protein